MADTQLEKVRLTAKNIKSSLVSSTKKLKRVKLNNQRFLGKELDKKKKQEEEDRLEGKSPIKSTLGNVASKIVSGPMGIWNKILQFGSFMLAGIIAQHLPKIIDIIQSIFNLVASIVTPIMNGVMGLVNFIGGAPLDKSASDRDKQELDALNKEGNQVAKELEEFASTTEKESGKLNMPTSEEKSIDADVREGDVKAVREDAVKKGEEQKSRRSVEAEQKPTPKGKNQWWDFLDLFPNPDPDKVDKSKLQEVKYANEGTPIPPSIMMLDSAALSSWPAIVEAAKKDGVDINKFVKTSKKKSSSMSMLGSINPIGNAIEFKMDSTAYAWMLKNASKFHWKSVGDSKPNAFKYIGPSNKTSSSISPVNGVNSLNNAKGKSSEGTIIFAVQPVMQPFPVQRIVRVGSSRSVARTPKRDVSSIWRV
jgi:hypothetical protein